jgi:hypothetical protein
MYSLSLDSYESMNICHTFETFFGLRVVAYLERFVWLWQIWMVVVVVVVVVVEEEEEGGGGGRHVSDAAAHTADANGAFSTLYPPH